MQKLLQLTDEQQRLVEQNLPLVFWVARRYKHIREEDYLDLCGRMSYRLCRSISEWDPQLGKLSTYLVKCLEGEAKHYFRDDIWTVKPPRSLREKSLSEILDTTRDSPSQAQIQGEDADRVRTAILPLPLHDLKHSGGDSDTSGRPERFCSEETIPDETDVEAEVVSRLGGDQILREIFSALRPEERTILAIKMREAQPARLDREPRLRSTLKEIQARYGVSRADAEEILEELQEKVECYHHRLYAGYRCPESIGSTALCRALRRRWLPPVLSFTEVRKRAAAGEFHGQ